MKKFKELAEVLEKVEKFTERSVKVSFLSIFLKDLEPEELEKTIWLILGNIGREWEENKMNVSFGTLVQLFKKLNINRKEFIDLYKKLGDPADALKIILEKNKQKQQRLFKKEYTILEVFNILKSLEKIEGEGSRDKKVNILYSLYINLSPIEAKLITRILQGDMRYGVSEGLLEETLSHAFSIPLEDIQRAHMLLGDLGLVAKYIKEKGYEYIKNIKIELFNPVKPMLAEKAENIREVIDTLGLAAYEFKFDGIRAQIHKKGNVVRIFTRRLKEVTNSFPDIIKLILDNINADEVVLEGEIVGWDYKSNKPLPFQELVKRIKRKHEREKYIKEIPVRLFLFDILYLNGEMLIDKTFIERRKILESIKGNIDLTPMIISNNYEEIERFFNESVNMGNEGLVAKELNSKYIPGKRGKRWLKLKKTMEPLDLVIIGAEWGHGRRKKFLSDLYLAVRDEKTGKFYMVTKTFKGLSDKEYEELTKELLKLKIKEEGRIVWVKPKIVVEVLYDEIQKSPKYECGYALRFARVNRIRWDKSEKDVDTLQRLIELYKKQNKNL